MKPSRSTAARGFSLMELVLVVTILAVLAGLVIPSFSGRSERSHLESNGLRIAALARMARSYAINSGRTLRLELFTEPSELRFGAAEGSYPLAEDFVDVPVHWARPFVLAGRTTIEPSEYFGEQVCTCPEADHVYLFPDGSAQPVRVRLANADGDTLAIDFSRSTARVDVRRLWEEEP